MMKSYSEAEKDEEAFPSLNSSSILFSHQMELKEMRKGSHFISLRSSGPNKQYQVWVTFQEGLVSSSRNDVAIMTVLRVQVVTWHLPDHK